MPFGKYKGKLIEEVDSGYLVYCLENFNLNPNIARVISDELVSRFSTSSAPFPSNSLVKTIYRNLSKKYHPDVAGGNTIAMQAINEFHELLRRFD